MAISRGYTSVTWITCTIRGPYFVSSLYMDELHKFWEISKQRFLFYLKLKITKISDIWVNIAFLRDYKSDTRITCTIRDPYFDCSCYMDHLHKFLENSKERFAFYAELKITKISDIWVNIALLRDYKSDTRITCTIRGPYFDCSCYMDDLHKFWENSKERF